MTSVLVLTGSENVLVFGGRTPSCLALGDCYLLNRKTQMWRKVTTSKKLFSSFGVTHTKLKLSRKVPALKGCGKSRWAFLFTMCKKVSGKSGWEVNGHDFFSRSTRKLPGAAEHLKRSWD